MSWFIFYCIISPLAIIAGLTIKEFSLFYAGDASLAFIIVYSTFALFLIKGITARKLWAWRLNFSFLLLPVIYLGGLILFKIISPSVASANDISSDTLKIFAVAGIYLTVLALPIQIFFYRIKTQFLHNEGDLEVSDVYGITLAITIPLLSLLINTPILK